MILVDSSVLVNFLKGVNGPQVQKFEEILKQRIPFGITALIYQELLQGAKNQKEFDLLESYLSSQKFYGLKHGVNSYREAALIFLKCRNRGITIRSTVDLLIAQTALENNLFLLHDDKDFTNMTQVISELKIW